MKCADQIRDLYLYIHQQVGILLGDFLWHDRVPKDSLDPILKTQKKIMCLLINFPLVIFIWKACLSISSGIPNIWENRNGFNIKILSTLIMKFVEKGVYSHNEIIHIIKGISVAVKCCRFNPICKITTLKFWLSDIGHNIFFPRLYAPVMPNVFAVEKIYWCSL